MNFDIETKEESRERILSQNETKYLDEFFNFNPDYFIRESVGYLGITENDEDILSRLVYDVYCEQCAKKQKDRVKVEDTYNIKESAYLLGVNDLNNADNTHYKELIAHSDCYNKYDIYNLFYNINNSVNVSEGYTDKNTNEYIKCKYDSDDYSHANINLIVYPIVNYIISYREYRLAAEHIIYSKYNFDDDVKFYLIELVVESLFNYGRDINRINITDNYGLDINEKELNFIVKQICSDVLDKVRKDREEENSIQRKKENQK